jgi:hypothetical protein
MKRGIIVCGVLAVVIGGSSVARAEKPPKCVFPSLTFTVVNTPPGLESDGAVSAVYTDGVDGVGAEMNTCGGTGDVVLSLDTTRRTMKVSLSDGMQIARRVDVTGVQFVTASCSMGQFSAADVTIWETEGFLKVNGNNGSDRALVCRNADGSWRVLSTASASAARFAFYRGRYTYTGVNEYVPFDFTVAFK